MILIPSEFICWSCRFFWVSSGTVSGKCPVKRAICDQWWAQLISPLSVGTWVEQLLYHAVMQPLRMLSEVQRYKKVCENAWGHSKPSQLPQEVQTLPGCPHYCVNVDGPFHWSHWKCGHQGIKNKDEIKLPTLSISVLLMWIGACSPTWLFLWSIIISFVLLTFRKKLSVHQAARALTSSL